MMRIFGDLGSGNCLKVKTTADTLGIAYAWTHIDILKGQSRTPEFLALSPAGQVPIVQLSDGRVLSQSNAIIRYLARGSHLLPEDAFTQAEIDAWLFWEQNSHEPFVAGARFQRVYLRQPAEHVPARTMANGAAALDRMEAHLGGQAWFVNDGPTIADIALAAYTRLAPEGGFDLTGRPAVTAWLARCDEAFFDHPLETAP